MKRFVSVKSFEESDKAYCTFGEGLPIIGLDFSLNATGIIQGILRILCYTAGTLYSISDSSLVICLRVLDALCKES